MYITSVMPSNHHIFYCPLLFLPSIFPRVFSNESTLQIRWLKYWCFSFSISPSNEYSGLISFLIDWFNLLAVQRTLKSLLQHLSSEAPSLTWDSMCQEFWRSHRCFTPRTRFISKGQFKSWRSTSLPRNWCRNRSVVSFN